MRARMILRGRDEIQAVLVPVLGAGVAWERANNITQVLVLCRRDPTQVARGMLRTVLVRGDLEQVASDVGQAWERGSSTG